MRDKAVKANSNIAKARTITANGFLSASRTIALVPLLDKELRIRDRQTNYRQQKIRNSRPSLKTGWKAVTIPHCEDLIPVRKTTPVLSTSQLGSLFLRYQNNTSLP